MRLHVRVHSRQQLETYGLRHVYVIEGLMDVCNEWFRHTRDDMERCLTSEGGSALAGLVSASFHAGGAAAVEEILIVLARSDTC